MNGSNIKLYPSNWLYNAGVLGLLRLLEGLISQGIQLNIKKGIDDDGTVNLHSILNQNSQIDKNIIFEKWKQHSEKLYDGQEAYYANQTESSIKRKIEKLLGSFSGGYGGAGKSKRSKLLKCSFCGIGSPKSEGNFLNQAFSKILLGSEKSFRNMYWNFESKDFVGPECEFIIMCHHLAFTPLPDGSEIFINAPSFKVMYYLNKYVQSLPKDGNKIKHLLGMSLIEFSTKLKAQLGLWTSMNIEVVIKYKYKKDSNRNKYEDKIDFFSLPAEIVSLLNDHEISSLIYQIGEFKVLDIVLDGKFNKLIEDSYRLMKILKDQRSESDKEFLKEYFKKNQKDDERKKAVQNMLKLYALIEERTEGRRIWKSTV
jgi:CRISPR-associated protein Cst1